MVLDDTTWQRFTRKAEAVSFVWDSRIGKVVFGMSVVLLIWTDGKRKVPLLVFYHHHPYVLRSEKPGSKKKKNSLPY